MYNKKEYAKRYYQKNKKKLLASQKAWVDANRDRRRVWDRTRRKPLTATQRTAKKAQQRLYYKQHPELKKAYATKHHEKLIVYWRVYKRKKNQERRLEILTHYAGGVPICACCGERTVGFLTIDHIAGGGNKHRKKIKANLYDWLHRNNYPPGFQVLCYNCNCGRARHGGICPHKIKI